MNRSVQNKFFSIGGLPCQFHAVDTIGDGSCFFHSLCDSMDLHGYRSKSHMQKKKIAHDLRNNYSYLLSFDDAWHEFSKRADYLNVLPRKEVFRKIKDSREWSEINIISFVLDKLGKGAIFFDDQVNEMYCGARGDPNAKEFFLIMWEDRSHFRNIRCGDKGLFPKNGKIMRHLLKKDKCERRK